MLILGLLYLKPLMCALGATQTMLPHACAYGRIILMGAPIMCGSFILNCILRAEGAAVASMIGLCSGGILNIALDPLLIFTFGMGTAGAAVATVISQCVSFLVLAVAARQKHRSSAPEVYQPQPARLRADSCRRLPDDCPAGHGKPCLGAYEHTGRSLWRRCRRGAYDLQ